MSSGDITRMAAWLSLLSFAQEGPRNDNGARLVEGALESEEVEIIPKAEIASVTAFSVGATVPNDEVVGVEAMLRGLDKRRVEVRSECESCSRRERDQEA